MKGKKDKTEKQYRAFIQSVIDKYAPILLLNNFIVVMKKEKEGDDYYLACKYRYPYLDGVIIYSNRSMEDWKKEPKEYHERKLVHELCHLITDPLYGKATTLFVSKTEIEDERERLTDHIANIICKLTP